MVACVFEEVEPELTRISLRSKSDKINVNEIAAQFGGGGHSAAAGARIPGKPLAVQRKVIAAVKKALKPREIIFHARFFRLDGAILVDKPAGPTSHDVVDAIRRRFQIKKVGHCGTLDPNATGLLIIVLGRGTKLSEKLMGDDKVYEGTIKFGETTDSYDADGEMTASLARAADDAGRVERGSRHIHRRPDANAADGFGDQDKRRAALQTGAQRHRSGTRAALDSHLQFSFHELRRTAGRISRRLHQGHLRPQLAHELGQKLGCGAHLATLRRSVSGKFDVADALPLDAILKLTAAELEKRVLPFLKLAAA